jgi:general secretion pathway protein B
MSYILDALKRAERERTLGQAPAALDEVAPPPPVYEERPGQRWLLIAAGFVVIAAVAGYVGYSLSRPTAPAAAAQAAAVQVAAAPALAPVVAPVTESPPSSWNDAAYEQARREARIQDGSNITSLDDLTGTPPPATGAPAEVEPAPAPAAPAPAPAAPPAPKPSPALESAIAADAAVKTIKIEPPQTRAEAADAAARDALTTPIDPAPPRAVAAAQEREQRLAALHQFKEMPSNFRAEFPPLKVDVHVYNDNPQSRFVIVNGKRYHESDALAEGPRIAEIVPEGIVFEWHGEKVLYALSR